MGKKWWSHTTLCGNTIEVEDLGDGDYKCCAFHHVIVEHNGQKEDKRIELSIPEHLRETYIKRAKEEGFRDEEELICRK